MSDPVSLGELAHPPLDPEVIAILHEKSVLELAQELVQFRKMEPSGSRTGNDSRALRVLRAQVRDLLLRVDELEQQKSRCMSIDSLVIRPEFRQPPVEVLLLIFEHTLDNTWHMNSGLWNGPESAWCKQLRMKKSLVRVCKAWYGAASGFLYKDIVLRRIGQVSALAWTLQSANSYIGRQIRSISLTCAVEKRWTKSFGEGISSIIHHSPNLNSLSLKPCLPLPCAFSLLKNALVHVSSNITAIHYVIREFSYVDLRFLLDSCRSLTRLQLSTRDLCNTTQPDSADDMDLGQPLKGVTLDALEYLRLDLSNNEKNILPTIEETWHMKSLNALTINLVSRLEPSSLIWDHLKSLIQRHGARLRYFQLHIPTPYHLEYTDRYESIPNIRFILMHTPLLEHLALCMDTAFSSPVYHERLKWVDVFWHGGPEPQEELRRCFTKGTLRSLCGVRYLGCRPQSPEEIVCATRMEEELIEIPLRVPPEESSLDLQPSTIGIWPFDLGDIQVEPELFDSDSEGDSEYEPDEGEYSLYDYTSDVTSSFGSDDFSDGSETEEDQNGMDEYLAGMASDVLEEELGN